MDLPHPTWENFSNRFFMRWKQGEHVFINGQTGSGKTELLLTLLSTPWFRSNGQPRDKYSVVFVTKPRDAIFKSPLAKPYKRIRTFAPKPGDKLLMLEAANGDSTLNTVGNQAEVFRRALDTTYHQGGWTVGSDETLWLANRLRLKNEIGDANYMGRALGVTMVSATQRPAHIPVIIPQSATHAFIAKTARKSDMVTLSELGADPAEVAAALRSLRDKHDFLYVDTSGELPLMVVNTRA